MVVSGALAVLGTGIALTRFMSRRWAVAWPRVGMVPISGEVWLS